MTSRERLFAALAGRPSDHVPVWLLFPYHPTSYYVDVRRHPAYRPVAEAARRMAVTLNRRHFRVPLHAPAVTWRHEDSGGVKRSTLTCGAARLVQEQGPGRVKKLLDTDEDLAAWLRLPLNLDARAIRAALDGQLARHEQERREFPTDDGAMMLDLGEPIGPLYGHANLESYAIWSLTHDEAVREFLDRVMVQKRIVYTWCLERELADVYFLVGSELASPPLVSRATFQRWILPHARELIALVRGHGKHVIQHYHGAIREILPDFAAMSPDGLHTIEAPPVGDCTFTQAYETLGDGITLIGNVQYDEFRARSRPQMEAAVRQVLDECRGRRLILSPSAGPFDENPSPRLIENYLTFLETAWAYPWA